MISKKKFCDIFKSTRLVLYDINTNDMCDHSIHLLFYKFINDEISESELLVEIEKKRFQYVLREYKDEKGTAAEFYKQHKKLLRKDADKRSVFLKAFNLSSIKELKEKSKYPDIFYNIELRQKILSEQNNKCFLCDRDIADIWPNLHHINYNKKDCRRENLIFLCSRCHGKTNFNREFWTNYINEKVNN